jgi:hypothetical protein
MGMTRLNDKQVLAPTREMKVEDLKALAGIPKHEVLYEPKSGRVLQDHDVVPTEEADYGVVADWQRG